MNESKVLERFEKQKSEYSQTHEEMRRIAGYMCGRYYDEFEEGSTLRDEPKRSSLDGTIKMVVNLPFLTVQDNTALAAQDPQIDVPPKDAKSEKHALMLKKIHYATYEHSGGNNLMQDSTYYERAYGWSVFGALPDLSEKRIKFVSYDPRNCYPVFKMGSRVFLSELFVSWKESGAAVKAQFPDWPGCGDEDEVEFMEYFSLNERMRFADGEMVSGIHHDWGFVPFVVIPCMPTPDGLGVGDVHQTVGLAIANTKLHNLLYQYIYENVNAETAAYTDDEIEPPVRLSNNRLMWKFSRDAKVEKMADTSGHMFEAFRMVQELSDVSGAITGTGAARQGRREGMYVSGGGQAALMQPLGNRIDNSLRIKSERLSLVFEYALRLYEKHFKNTKLNLYGRMAKSPFEVSFRGKDIKGYYRVQVSWLPAILHDAGNRMIQLLQQNKSRLISNYTTTNLLGIADPEFEKKQIEEEMFAQANLEGAMQRTVQEQLMTAQATSPAPGQDTNPDTVPHEKLQLEKGRTNETASGLFGGAARPGLPAGNMRQLPAVQPGGGPPVVPGAPGGALPVPVLPYGGGRVSPDVAGAYGLPGAVGEGMGLVAPEGMTTLEQLADGFRAVNKVRGKVYLVGKVVFVGFLPETEDIEVTLTDMLDKQTLINALPDYRGRLKFLGVEGMPKEPHIDVTPGTSGYEPMAHGLEGMGPEMPMGMPTMPMGMPTEMPTMPGGTGNAGPYQA